MFDMLNIKDFTEVELEKLNYEIAVYMRGTGLSGSIEHFGMVYAAYLVAEYDLKDSSALEEYIEKNGSETRRLFLKGILVKGSSGAIELANNVGKDKLAAYLYHFPYYASKGEPEKTPGCIADLALRVLDIGKKDTVADFGCGAGDFMLHTAGKGAIKSFYGIEISSLMYEVATIRAELFADKAEIHIGDMFAIDEQLKFDKVFSNYPFALRLPFLGQPGQDYVKRLSEKIPDLKKATSSDWIFNSLVIDHLKNKGRAVAIASNGSTWNSLDRSIREYFIKKGYIEAVIALPAKMFEMVSIPTTMYVLSYGNDSIRMIDAKSICEQGRRQNIFTSENIDEIVGLLTADSEKSKIITMSELKEADYVLNPDRYLSAGVDIEEGVRFGDLMRRITRGAPLNASQLDEMVSEEPTDTQYLMLSNIQNGIISNDLPYLKDCDPKLEKYCIKKGNMLLSKNGAPFKIAVADMDDGRRVIGNGNLFIIELDEERVNPYFLKAFFDSDKGIAVMKSISVGTIMPNISAESLKNIKVPLPPMEKQLEIAHLYQAKQDEIKILRLRLERAQSELKGIFGEVG